MYVAYYPDAAFPGAAAVIGSFAESAVRCGVQHLVLLADRGAAEAERCERAVRESRADWTVVRTGFINQNFSEGFLADSIRAGVVALPVGAVPEPFTDAEDIADVAVAALTEDGYPGKILELTGPGLLTFEQAVGAIAKETGGQIRYVPVTAAQFVSRMIEKGAPTEYAEQLTALLVEVFDGRRAKLTDDVRRTLGRSPRDFTD